MQAGAVRLFRQLVVARRFKHEPIIRSRFSQLWHAAGLRSWYRHLVCVSIAIIWRVAKSSKSVVKYKHAGVGRRYFHSNDACLGVRYSEIFSVQNFAPMEAGRHFCVTALNAKWVVCASFFFLSRPKVYLQKRGFCVVPSPAVVGIGDASTTGYAHLWMSCFRQPNKLGVPGIFWPRKAIVEKKMLCESCVNLRSKSKKNWRKSPDISWEGTRARVKPSVSSSKFGNSKTNLNPSYCHFCSLFQTMSENGPVYSIGSRRLGNGAPIEWSEKKGNLMQLSFSFFYLFRSHCALQLCLLYEAQWYLHTLESEPCAIPGFTICPKVHYALCSIHVIISYFFAFYIPLLCLKFGCCIPFNLKTWLSLRTKCTQRTSLSL